MLKVFILEDNIVAFFVFVAFDDLFPWNLPAVGFGNLPVTDTAMVCIAEQIETDPLLGLRGRIQSYWDVDETETNRAFPKCSHKRLLLTCANPPSRVKTRPSRGAFSATDVNMADLKSRFWPIFLLPSDGEPLIYRASVKTNVEEHLNSE